MKKGKNSYKLLYGIFLCVFILAGCSNDQSIEEKSFMEDEKMMGAESESGSVLSNCVRL